MVPSSSFDVALKHYSATYAQSPEKRGLLVYESGKWKKVMLSSSSKNSDILLTTMQKVLDLDLTGVNKSHLLYWIEQFNSNLSLEYLKNREIRPVDLSVPRIQFSSMNHYRWLSNFFPTLIYDPTHQMIYPSVENGYVAFKARKSEITECEVTTIAHIIGSKRVKQLGREFWQRSSESDNQIAIAEMERLVSLKFQQNPFLANWLKKTEAPLEEFTNDSFWGSAMGTLTEDDNANQLGQIIGQVRAVLKQKNIE